MKLPTPQMAGIIGGGCGLILFLAFSAGAGIGRWTASGNAEKVEALESENVELRNKIRELEIVRIFAQSQINRLTAQIPKVDTSADSRHMLLLGIKSPKGVILDGGRRIFTDDRKNPVNDFDDPRSYARWKEALELLERERLIAFDDIANSYRVYRITQLGYDVAGNIEDK